MPYIITNSDGTLTVTVADQQVDTSTFSLALVGRSVSNFGQYFAENWLRQLENFASTVQPSPATRLVGQLWYDKNENVLRVWNGSNWKRATNVLVGSHVAKPQAAYAGDVFFNTTTNKLEVHNGIGFKEAGYAGTVTNAYSSDSTLQNPAFYGSRVRTLFLTDENNLVHPVLAFSYVNSSQSSPNAGTTQVGEQYETIMAIVSDSEFIIRTSGNGTATPVDGTVVNFAPELTAIGTGIASARSGRSQGQILKGINVRAEYEGSGIAIFEQLYATSLGTVLDPVSSIVTNDLTVNGQLVVSDIEIQDDVVIDGSLTLAGNLNAPTGSATFANLTVTANTSLSGAINITGVANIDGVINLTGQMSADYVNAQDALINDALTVNGNVSVPNGTGLFLTLQSIANTVVGGNLEVSGPSHLYNNTTIYAPLEVYGTANISSTVIAPSANIYGTANINVLNVSGPVAFGDVTTTGNIDSQGLLTASNATIANLTVTSSIAGNVVGNVSGNLTGNVTGNVTGSLVGPASQVTLVATNTTNATHYPLFANGATGSEEARTDTSLTYNPSTNILTVGGISSSGTVTAATVAGTTITFGDMSDGAITINGFVNEPGMNSNSPNLLPTQSSVKAYVDATVANANIGGGGGGSNITGVYGNTNIIGGGTSGIITLSLATTLTGMTAATFSGNVSAANFNGVASSARYADLAEVYEADADYEPGTVVKLGGTHEITCTTSAYDIDVFGVISTNPAYLMNAEAVGLPVAFTGRVPVLVTGRIAKGERLVSSDIPGVAQAMLNNAYDPRMVIGRSLEEKVTDGPGVIEVVVGVK